MNVAKQFINVVGLVIVLGILAAGSLVVALPLFLQGQSLSGEAVSVVAKNQSQQTQIDVLAAQAKDQTDIDDALTALRVQIPVKPQLDDVMELVAMAAGSANATITSITTSGAAPFARRGADPAATEGAPADAGADVAVGTPAVESPQQQIPVSITVTAPNITAGVAFLDALRDGPRLLENVQTEITPGGVGVTVTVAALAFVSSEG